MNERIKQLAVNAGLESTDFPYDEFGMPHEQLKFAELIVKECAKVATRLENDEFWVESAYDVITKHFGVNE